MRNEKSGALEPGPPAPTLSTFSQMLRCTGDVIFGSVGDTKPCPRRGQLSSKAVAGCRRRLHRQPLSTALAIDGGTCPNFGRWGRRPRHLQRARTGRQWPFSTRRVRCTFLALEYCCNEDHAVNLTGQRAARVPSAGGSRPTTHFVAVAATRGAKMPSRRSS